MLYKIVPFNCSYSRQTSFWIFECLGNQETKRAQTINTGFVRRKQKKLDSAQENNAYKKRRQPNEN